MNKKLKNNKNNNKQNKNSSKNSSGFEPDNFDWKKASKTSFIWMAIILGAVYVSGLLTNGGKKEMFYLLDKNQISAKKKIKYCDYLIVNNKSKNYLKKKVTDIIK